MHSQLPLLTLLVITTITILFKPIQSHGQGMPAQVESSTDGRGWFTYTFRRGTANHVWRLDPLSGSIYIQSRNVLEIVDPPGWTHTRDENDLIEWRPVDQFHFLDEPISFRVRSCLIDSIAYRSITPGYIVGGAYRLPERTEYLAGGYQSFDYIGPALPRLEIQQKGRTVVVSWNTTLQGISLETHTDSGAQKEWSTVSSNSISENRGHFSAVFPISNERRFFRLVPGCR